MANFTRNFGHRKLLRKLVNFEHVTLADVPTKVTLFDEDFVLVRRKADTPLALVDRLASSHRLFLLCSAAAAACKWLGTRCRALLLVSELEAYSWQEILADSNVPTHAPP